MTVHLGKDRMRVILVTRNFPPLVGGMETLLYEAYRALKEQFDVALIGPSGSGDFIEPDSRTLSIAHSPLSRFLLHAQWESIKLAIRFRPQLVLAGSGLAAPAAFFAARAVAAKVACFVHGLDLVVDNLLYRKVFLPTIVKSDCLIANSRNTADLAVSAGAVSDRVSVLRPGVAMPLEAQTRTRFRERLGLSERPILLSVGRLTPRKGVYEFVRHALPSVVARRPDAVLVVIGDDPKDAVKSSSRQQQRILEAARECGVRDHVRLLGRVDNTTLSDAYAAADVFLFPAIEVPGDVEGYGMVALEAAAHGVATVAFSVGGISDAVKDGVSGYLVPPGDYEQFVEVLLRHINADNREEWSLRCRTYAESLGWDRYGQELTRILNALVAC